MAVTSFLLMVAQGCSGNESDLEVPPGARHAIHSARLQSVMAVLGAEVRTAWPDEPIGDRPAPPRLSEADLDRTAAAAGRLANAAPAIAEAVPEKMLSGPDRQRFMRLVAELESNARGLENQATSRDSVNVEASLARIRRTCNSCHVQFRALTGSPRWGW